MNIRLTIGASLVLVLILLAAGTVLSAQETESRIRLWIRGDDFGYTHASNIAMEKAFTEGVMQSASLLVPGPWFAEAAAIARRHPEWSVGVHLTITSEWNTLRWRPVSPISEVPSLVAPDGYLWGRGYKPRRPDSLDELASPWATHLPAKGEVEKEFGAQIERAKTLGLKLDYVDCHMGLGCSDDLYPITRKLAAENCLAVSSEKMFAGMGRLRIDWRERTAKEAKRLLAQKLRELTPGLWLYVAHPAADTAELRAVDTEVGEQWARQRSSVLAAWTDPAIRSLIEDLGIQLVNARALFDYQACRPKP